MNEADGAQVSSTATLSAQLCRICHLFGERQWCLATSGNFSARVDAGHFLITQSGRDKSALTPADLMICNLDGRPQLAQLRPSAETALHQCLYRHGDQVGAVLHTHSVTSTVLSRHIGDSISFSGYEMQKAFAGVTSHEATIEVPVFDNSQDMPALADELRQWLRDDRPPAFLIRGHGLYAWGTDLAAAQRHAEAMEFLMSCLWAEMQATSR
jgi:methylthioribulose-1-phosphate dehydratase